MSHQHRHHRPSRVVFPRRIAISHTGGNFMTVRGFARFTFSIAGMLALAGLSGAPARAEQDHAHGDPVPNALVKIVREVTEPYKNVAAAEAAGYTLAFGCVSGP